MIGHLSFEDFEQVLYDPWILKCSVWSLDLKMRCLLLNIEGNLHKRFSFVLSTSTSPPDREKSGSSPSHIVETWWFIVSYCSYLYLSVSKFCFWYYRSEKMVSKMVSRYRHPSWKFDFFFVDFQFIESVFGKPSKSARTQCFQSSCYFVYHPNFLTECIAVH